MTQPTNPFPSTKIKMASNFFRPYGVMECMTSSKPTK